MIISETLFVTKRPVGRMFMDTLTRDIAFQATDGCNPFPHRIWRSAGELRQAVNETYFPNSKISTNEAELSDSNDFRRGSQPK